MKKKIPKKNNLTIGTDSASKDSNDSNKIFQNFPNAPNFSNVPNAPNHGKLQSNLAFSTPIHNNNLTNSENKINPNFDQRANSNSPIIQPFKISPGSSDNMSPLDNQKNRNCINQAGFNPINPAQNKSGISNFPFNPSAVESIEIPFGNINRNQGNINEIRLFNNNQNQFNQNVATNNYHKVDVELPFQLPSRENDDWMLNSAWIPLQCNSCKPFIPINPLNPDKIIDYGKESKLENKFTAKIEEKITANVFGPYTKNDCLKPCHTLDNACGIFPKDMPVQNQAYMMQKTNSGSL